ncbi:cyclic nucleotide-binding domain protein (macronuclear) [Tetrahymena thermophila SB210]|uniref:Cyclic nucleotide-binding domain protein n=1 Tax=Tetrahymena thermophila (strain SB210) TaxID=312017 RepID=Q23GB9_TETTS|nr:cyclic nucleotide-binding domain protein [Tetrahymena thermophila SB210]EAR95341.3 cyclic nucleotide-binding domain protein [Tetrahymena thermophila SB210]|eukprot:XP_001015586.3 cyclic nucleotide-binding domain protein [Tetrahymena thermophila SB210]
MTTIGYGDFTAQTQLEKLLMIFIAFFSCGIFGYTINSIGNILYDFKQKKDLYLQELAKINKYFKQNNVELGLQCRARKYIQYQYSDENSDNISSIKSLSNLSEYLQKEIQTDVYIRKLKKIKVFSEIFTDEVLVELSLQMKEAFYCHDQIIQQNEEESDQYLYFVNNGIILEYCQYQQNTVVKEIQEYRQGEFFGLLAFLQGDNSRKVKYKSVGVSSILKISFSSFINVLKDHNLAYQKFCFIRDEVKFSNKLIKINAYCDSCQQQNHVLEQCPYLFYEGKKQVILRNYFRQQDNIYKNFRRQSTTKSQNALLNQNLISKQADRYYISNIEFFSMWDLTDDSGYENDDDLKNFSQQNSSKLGIEKQKTNQEGSTDKNMSSSSKRESFFPSEQHKELSVQCLSEKQIIFQEIEKNHSSSSKQKLINFTFVNNQLIFYKLKQNFKKFILVKFLQNNKEDIQT